MEEFIVRADWNFNLKAEWQPDVKALLSGCFGSKEETVWGFVVSVDPAELKKMKSGVKYSLVPENSNPIYKWIVNDGVTITRL